MPARRLYQGQDMHGWALAQPSTPNTGIASAPSWIVLTDLAPQDAGVRWYGLRVWIELGFRALKGVGWQW